MKNSFMPFILFSFSFFLVSTNVLADPNTVEIGISCPTANGTGTHTLSNFGNRISGYGSESINSNPAPMAPYFNLNFTSGNFPIKIASGAYSSTGTDYDPTTGRVTCSYTSATFDPITVTYQMTNGFGGVILSQTAETIVINQYIGLKRG